MKTGQLGINLIKSFEGLSLKAYLCPAGVLTIGYGHTGSNVMPGQIISEEQAENLLRIDLNRFEVGVANSVSASITQNQFDALVSLSFNIGLGAFKNSTLLKLLNDNRPNEAASQFLRWNKGGGKVLPGLTRRREAEMNLFLS